MIFIQLLSELKAIGNEPVVATETDEIFIGTLKLVNSRIVQKVLFMYRRFLESEQRALMSLQRLRLCLFTNKLILKNCARATNALHAPCVRHSFLFHSRPDLFGPLKLKYLVHFSLVQNKCQ